METDREFQITLPSNASMKTSPDNRPANYTTTLGSPLNIEGEWEVALIDVQYPHNWMNIPKDVYILFTFQPKKLDRQFFVDIETITNYGKTAYSAETKDELKVAGKIDFVQLNQAAAVFIRLPKGYYATVTELVTVINQCIQDELNRMGPVAREKIKEIDIAYQVNPITRTLRLYLKGIDKLEVICLDKQVKSIFNKAKAELSDKAEVLGEEKLLWETISSIYVYTDIIKYQFIGDVKAPVLGLFPVQGKDGDQSYWCFQPPIYNPLQITDIPKINIQLVDDTGEEIPFAADGKVVVRLHFRRIRSLL